MRHKSVCGIEIAYDIAETHFPSFPEKRDLTREERK